jgi:hypothetical protein
LPVKPGACLVDAVGRQLEAFHGDRATVRLSIIPVFVRGLDLARLRFEPLPEPVRFAPNPAPVPEERRVWLQAVTRPGVPLNQEFQQKHKLALPAQPGQVERLELRVHNWSDREQSGELSIDLPDGWTCDTATPISVNVSANSCATVHLDLLPAVSDGQPPATPATVSVRATLRINGCQHDVVRVDYLPVNLPGKWISPSVNSWTVSRLLPGKSDVAKAGSVKLSAKLDWRVVHAGTPEGFLSIHDHHGEKDGLVYLGNTFIAPSAGVWSFYLGHDGGARVFVDGHAVLTVPECINPSIPGRSKVDLNLARGSHEIVIAFDTANGRGWGIFACFGVPKGHRGKGKPVFPKVMESAGELK